MEVAHSHLFRNAHAETGAGFLGSSRKHSTNSGKGCSSLKERVKKVNHIPNKKNFVKHFY
jgi:hypothetical protein